ncbi:hypothetical protein Tco_1031501 [Tanacetum coccineum]|uniref:Zinc knuckle CX2CX4HX4C n=1 Tax=Tanacetum coccineum TaxID=301880 RepID=A0ABQ5G963_9ASTR
MERGFLSQKGSRGGRDVKENNQVSANDVAKVVSISSKVKEPVLSSLGGHIVVPNEGDVTNLPTDPYNSGPIFSRPTSYAKLDTGEPSKKNVNFHTLLAPVGNEADVAISSKDRMDEMIENGPWSSYATTMIELRADAEVKDTIVMAMPKLVGEGFYICTKHVEYEWKPPKCLSCKVFSHVLDECPKKIVSNVVNNLKNLRQAARGVQVGPKVGFKPTKQVYKHVYNKNCASTSVGTNEGNSKVAEKGSLNVAPRSSSTTPIEENIDNLERQILDEKVIFVDDDGKLLYNVDSTGIADSDSEVEEVLNKTTDYMASTSLKSVRDSGYGTSSLLEQWRKTKRDYDYDPYDNDLYESHDMSENLQAICDDFDITARARKKK